MRRRYLHFTAWEQLQGTAERYKPAVANVELVEPIGELHASAFGKCGLRNCKQPQKNSLLVSLKGGGYTNIGFDCGATHFPHLWADLKRRSKVYRDQETAIVSLETLFEKLPALENDYAAVLARCSRPIALMTSFRRELPTQVLAELARRAGNGEDVVEGPAHIDFDVSRRRPRAVGALKGLISFRVDRDICAAATRAGEILKNLRELEKKGFNTSGRELVTLRKQIDRDADFLPALMRMIEDTSILAESFFTQPNLDLILTCPVFSDHPLIEDGALVG